MAKLTSMNINKNSSAQEVSFDIIDIVDTGDGFTVTANSSNELLINNVDVVYTSPERSGTIVFAPIPNADGTTVITIVVSNGTDEETHTLDVRVVQKALAINFDLYSNNLLTNDDGSLITEVSEKNLEQLRTDIINRVNEALGTDFTDTDLNISDFSIDNYQVLEEFKPLKTNIIKLNNTTGDERLNADLEWTQAIFDSIIVQSNSENTYVIDIRINDNLPPGVLANARHGNPGLIQLGSSWLDRQSYLNDKLERMVGVVLFHEIAHCLGLVGTTAAASRFIYRPLAAYTGPKGVQAYTDLLTANGIVVDEPLTVIPIEDDFGAGTKMAHFDEGINPDRSAEIRVINGVSHPIIGNEIMTGFIDSSPDGGPGHNYLTIMTLGVLEDLGFVVNYDSEWVSKEQENLRIVYLQPEPPPSEPESNEGATCILSTAAYHHDLITAEELMSIVRWRMRIQRHQILADQKWLGYQITWKPVANLMLKSKFFATIITNTLIKNWLHKWIPNGIGYSKFIIEGLSLLGFYINYKKCKELSSTRTLNPISIIRGYKNLIKNHERNRDGM